MIDAHFHYNFSGKGINEDIEDIYKIMQDNSIDKILLHIINEDFLERNLSEAKWGDKIIPSYMLNPKDLEIDKKIEFISSCGIRFVKVLPYEQQILYEDFPIVLDMCSKLQQRGIGITICGAYGSKYIYQTNGVDLTEYILRNGITTPVILAHGGMTKVLDAFSIMQEYPNLYMDISFALSFWWESSLIEDYAFVLKKLNYDRVFYGSDYPSLTIQNSLLIFEQFISKYEINAENKIKILKSNFEKFIT